CVQQPFNLPLEKAYLHVFIPVEALIWIRSIAIVLLIVAHAMRHVRIEKKEHPHLPVASSISPEQLCELRQLLTQTTITQAQGETLQLAETVTELQTASLETEEQEILPDALLPSVSEEERNKVIAAYTKGIPRR